MKTYINGDEGEYTGESQELHGGTFYSVRMLEGRHKGQIRVTSLHPGEIMTPDQKQSQQDWKDQQASFRRLRDSK